MAEEKDINQEVDLEDESQEISSAILLFCFLAAGLGFLGFIFDVANHHAGWGSVWGASAAGLAIVVNVIFIIVECVRKGIKRVQWGPALTILFIAVALFGASVWTGMHVVSVANVANGVGAEVDAMGTAATTNEGMVANTYAQGVGEEVEAFGYVDEPNFNTEEYNAQKENGFVSTKANPLSTLSADVDTASYCNVRRMINDGMKVSEIPSGAVRIEEMLNYFDYDYPQIVSNQRHTNDKFDIYAQAAQCPWNEDTQLLVFGFQAGSKTQAVNNGSNLVFLIDVSGSMDDVDKLPLLQESFGVLVDNLNANDRVSIVTYANGEKIILEGASGNEKDEILSAINGLEANGSTNGEAGLKQAYEVAQRNYIEGGTNRIVMASDGDLNVGMSSESELYDFVDKKRESGIYLSVLGFGEGNYKDNKMEVLADHGNGNYNYIDCTEEAVHVLQDKLMSNIVPFADDVKVQIEFNPSQIKAYRLIGYENRDIADEDFRNDEVDAADVGPGAQFTLVYEVVPVDSAMEINEPELKYSQETTYSEDSASDEWLTCTLRYHDFDSDSINEEVFPVDGNVVVSNPSDDWKFAAAVIEFGMLANDSNYAGTSSLESINELLSMQLNEQRSAFKDLVRKALS